LKQFTDSAKYTSNVSYERRH